MQIFNWSTSHSFVPSLNFYRPPMKLREGNVIICVCLSTGSGPHVTVTRNALQCNAYLNFCLYTTWFLDLNNLVRAWLCKEWKVPVLKANAKLVQKWECWTWNQRSRGSILTGVTFCYWYFLFLHSKASHANIGIIASVVCL